MRRDEILEVVEVKPLSVPELTEGERPAPAEPDQPRESQPARV